MSFVNIFSHFVGGLLVLLIVSFTVWKAFTNSSFLLLFPLPLKTCLVRRFYGWGKRCHCLCFSLGFWWFPVSHLHISPILSLFLVWYKKAVQFHSSACLCPAFTTPFVEEIFFHWIFFPALLKDCGSISGFSLLFHCSMCLFLC